MGTRASLEIEGLVKRYSSDVQIGPVSFRVEEGEFFSLLGTSGCGKTTILRCIAGFETPDEGRIILNGERLDTKAPHKRGVGLVFQNLTLFPHLTAAQNIGFGLALRKVPAAEVGRRVEAMLELVGLRGLGARMPNQLSGGQQQRVALARSLVLEPPLMLMDEPLSSLDLKLRLQMREELRQLQRRLHKTTIFVTHDQGEALALSDRIAVLSVGRIEQIGAPAEVYAAPVSCFVADFIGSSNLLASEIVARRGEEVEIVTAAGLRLSARWRANGDARAVTALIRPDAVRLLPEGPDGAQVPNSFAARVVDVTFLGEDIQLRVTVEEKETLLICQKSAGLPKALSPSQSLRIHVEPSDIFLLSR
ncbi:MAG: ABC transporter ATP-binding protein [Hyphomicrobiales bacterium]